MIALWLIVALCLDRVYLKLVAPYYNCEFSASYSTIPLVQAHTADWTIGRRILVPALIYWLEKLFPWLRPHRLPALYEPLRIGALAVALYVASLSVGTAGALLFAALLPASFLFDFWDFPYEILSFAAALSGDLRWTIVGGGLHGLARPTTAPLVPVIYVLVTGDWFGAALVTLAVGIGLIPGWLNSRQVPMVQHGRSIGMNWADVKNLFQNRPFYLSEIFMTMGLSALVLWAVFTGRAGAAWPVPLALVAVQWVIPRAAETRSLAVTLLWVVGGILR